MIQNTATKAKATASALKSSKLAIQGVVARFRSVRQGQLRRDSRKDEKPVVGIDALEDLSRNTKGAMLAARGSLAPDQYEEFLDYAFGNLPSVSYPPRHYYNVQGLHDSSVIPLEHELRWIVSWLNRHASEIERHLERVAKIDRLVLMGRFADALVEVDKHIDDEGHTLWAVQLALALEQRSGGLEAQKRRHEELRRRNRRGLLAYVSYMTSVRNEDRTTLSGFTSDLEARNARVRPRSLARYSAYRLAGTWPADRSAIADVLRSEQSNGPIDVFETLINLAQTCVRDAEKRWLRPLVCDQLRRLDVSDFRIDKALLHSGGAPRKAFQHFRSSVMADALFEGRLDKTLLFHPRCRGPADPWADIYAALAAAHSPRLRRSLRPSPARSLAVVAGQANDSNSYSAEFLKQSFNLANAPSQRAMMDFAGQLRTEGHSEPFRFSLPSLNSSLVGPEDLADYVSDAVTIEDVTRKFANTSSASFWRQEQVGGEGLRPEVRDFSTASALERREDHDAAIAVISPHVATNPSSLLRRLSSALLLSCLTVVQDKARIIALIADEAARPDASLDRLPVLPAMQLVTFADVSALGRSLAGIVFLDVRQRLTDDDAAASRLRFATKTFLRGTPNRKPSLMVDDGIVYSGRLLIYFLRYVCVPSVIDVSLIFQTSADVLEERQAICAVLNTLDPTNSEAYEAELLSLVHNRRIAAGLQIINKNRVHVDVEAIVRTFVRGGNELFQRYQDLLRAGIGVSDSYDEVLREITSATRHARPLIFTPENEADAALIQLVVRARDEFLHSTTGGLDFFLSKRIRHQSFVGLVRGPLEFENLVTTKETAASQYRENDVWLARFHDVPDKDRATISEAFTSFATAFDEAILNVKDKTFHVRSAEHPEGIFDIPITPTTMLLIRSVANSIGSSEEFVRAMIAIFWALLDPTLGTARRVIRDDLKMKVAALIDGLRTAVGSVANDSSAAAEFSLAVGRASSQVQTALSEAEAWFNRPDVAQAAQLFTLEEAVDIAIESARKLHRAFSPVIEREVTGDISLSAGDLVFITDAVFIAFSNVRAYSQLKAPKVSLECFVDEPQERLVLDVINDVAPRARSADQDAKLAALHELIDEGSVGKHVKREGGTGFLKLASVIRQSTKGELDFGYISDTQFRLHVAWSVIIKKASGESDADANGRR